MYFCYIPVIAFIEAMFLFMGNADLSKFQLWVGRYSLINNWKTFSQFSAGPVICYV